LKTGVHFRKVSIFMAADRMSDTIQLRFSRVRHYIRYLRFFQIQEVMLKQRQGALRCHTPARPARTRQLVNQPNQDGKRTDASPDVSGQRPLWAPWRIQYIRGPKTGECFFCGKAGAPERDAANHVIARGRHCFVLLNEFPYNSGHLMIAPYRHVADLDALTPEEFADILDLTVRSEQMLKKLMHPDGFNFGFNIGAAAGAGVKDHVHGHLVPRWVGDTNFMPVLGDTRVIPEALTETTRALRATWAELFDDNG